jgi:purine-binding chemotaxis protein CheW
MDDFNEGAGPGGPASDSDLYLTFLIGEEEYGFEILKVQEVKAFTAITPLPNVPAHIRGLMNLRGTIIPIIDLRRLFGKGKTQCNHLTVTIVVTVGSKVIGLLADAVSDVVQIHKDDIHPPPEVVSGGGRALTGIAEAGGKMVFFLDVECILQSEDEPTLQNMGLIG